MRGEEEMELPATQSFGAEEAKSAADAAREAEYFVEHVVEEEKKEEFVTASDNPSAPIPQAIVIEEPEVAPAPVAPVPVIKQINTMALNQDLESFAPPRVADADEQRRIETSQMITSGGLPEKLLFGEMSIYLHSFQNLQMIQGKPVIMYKVWHEYFPRLGTTEYEMLETGFLAKNVDWATGSLGHKIYLPQLTNQNLHTQGETMCIQLFMIREADPGLEDCATFAGELRFKWKHCLDDGKVNNWQWENVTVTDEERKLQRQPYLHTPATVELGVRYTYAEGQERNPAAAPLRSGSQFFSPHGANAPALAPEREEVKAAQISDAEAER